MEISNLSDAEFKTLLIRMLNELIENFNSIKKDQSEAKDTLTEMKNNLQGINCIVHEAENQSSNLEYKGAKNIQKEQQKEKKSKKMRIG